MAFRQFKTKRMKWEYFVPSAGGGGSNNIAIVGTPGGTHVENQSQVDSSSLNVTAGNTLIVGIVHGADGWTPASGDLTKIAGTATIGTVALDQSRANNGSERGLAIFRIPITGSGTLTVSVTNAGRAGNNYVMGWAEFSGFNATPLSTTNVVSGGPGVTASSGSISTVVAGVIIYVSGGLNSASDFTTTFSDTQIYQNGAASSTFPGAIQYKIINSSPNTLTDTTGANSATTWYVAFAAYKTS